MSQGTSLFQFGVALGLRFAADRIEYLLEVKKGDELAASLRQSLELFRRDEMMLWLDPFKTESWGEENAKEVRDESFRTDSNRPGRDGAV